MTVLPAALGKVNTVSNKSTNQFLDFIVILVIFVLVLGVTLAVTKWLADYQKQQGRYGNIELIEAARLGSNKYIQIVRAGEKYFVLAVCKDTVTLLGEVSGEELFNDSNKSVSDAKEFTNFKSMLESAVKSNPMIGRHQKDKDT